MIGVSGRVAIVTGASSGIGAATARALAMAGAKVVASARRQDRLVELVRRARDEGGEMTAIATDMRNESSVESMVRATVEAFGRIDLLVNNAAVGMLGAIGSARTDDWRAMLETNVLGSLVACRAVLADMLPRGSGSILNVTSASAYEAWPYLAVYAGSKAALHTISDGLRAEVAGAGVRVMTIEIHNVAGTDFASAFDAKLLGQAVQRWQQLGLLNRDSPMLRPEDAAAAILFMLSQPDPVSIHHLSLRSRAN